MSYVITNEEGYRSAQHHVDLDWPADDRLLGRCVRVYGRDPNTLDLLVADGPGGNMPDHPNTVGYDVGKAVWFASGAANPQNIINDTPYWGGAFPGVVAKPSATQDDPYKSKVVSPVSVSPAFWQDPKNSAAWVADTGVLPQKVAVAGGAALPAGTSVIVLPFSVTTEQQMAAFKASGELIAVWRGGIQNGPMGTLVYDVTAKGELDDLRRARVHSAWRVYRLPDPGTKPLIPFGGVPPQTTSGPLPLSGGLAWQLNLDIDNQAGWGMVVDRIPTTVPRPTQPEKTATGNPAVVDPSVATGTAFGGVAGQTNPNQPGGTTGLGSGTVTGNPGTVSPPPPGAAPQPGGAPGTVSPGPDMVIFGVTGKRGYGPFSVGSFNDQHRIGATPDGEAIHTTHWNVLTPIDGDGFDAPAETAGVWKKTTKGGPLVVPVYWRYDPNSNHPYIDKTIPGLRRWQTEVIFDVPPPKEEKPYQDKISGYDKTGGFDKSGGKDASEDKYSGKDAGKDAGKDSSEDGGTKYGGKDAVEDGGEGKVSWSDGGTSGKKPVEDGGGEGKVSWSDGGSGGGGSPAGGGGPGGVTVKKTAYDDTTYVPLPGGGYGKVGPGDNTTGQPTGISQGDLVYGGNKPGTKPKVGGGMSQTFGGYILGGYPPVSDGFDAGSTATILQNRRYARTPIEIAVPGLVARPIPLDGFDTRGRVDGLTPQQIAAYYASSPVAAVFSPLADQTGGSFRYFNGSTPGSGLYTDGVAKEGAFVLHPGNFDVRSYLTDGFLPPDYPDTRQIYWGSGWAMGDPAPSGGIMDGFDFYLDGSTIKGDTYVGGEVTATDTLWPPSSASGLSPCFYGDGSDGTATADGAGAVTGMTRSGSVYTMDRDVYFVELTVNGGVTIITNGYRLHVQGTLTNDGSINNDGGDGSGTSGGGGSSSGTLPSATGGGAGATQPAIGTTGGGAGTNATNSYGGAGGAGGDGTTSTGTGTGGASGTSTSPVAGFGSLHAMPWAALGGFFSFGVSTFTFAYGGGSGGGGGTSRAAGGGGNNTSGGGGGGGGPVIVLAKTLVNNGTISSDGGDGAVGTSPGVNEGSGGGGGGGGGFVVVAYGPGSDPGTITADGGSGGAGASSAPTGSSTNGTDGSDGTVISLCS